MAVTATPIFIQSVKMALTAYTTASSTATHITGGTNGSKILSLMAVSDSTSAHIFLVKMSTGGTALTIGAASVTASAGTDGATASINLLSTSVMPGLPLDQNGCPYLHVPSTAHTLTVTASAAINTGKQVTFSSVYGDY